MTPIEQKITISVNSDGSGKINVEFTAEMCRQITTLDTLLGRKGTSEELIKIGFHPDNKQARELEQKRIRNFAGDCYIDPDTLECLAALNVGRKIQKCLSPKIP